jgi:thiol-disulfide isomerase/thioredoxin
MASRKKVKEMRREELREVRLKQARRHRQQRILLAGGVVVVVLAVIGVLVGVKVTGGGGTAKADTSGRASPAVSRAVQNVPPSAFDKAGASSAGGIVLPVTGKNGSVQPISGSKLMSNGKPRVVYVGGEFCPYCAAERWVMATALSRFGTFHNLGATESASNIEDPNTKTLSFHKSSYSSKHLAFDPIEATTNQPKTSGAGYTKLESVPKDVQKLVTKYNPRGGIPFVDIGNRYAFSSQYMPSALKGMSRKQIATALHDPSSKVGKAILSSANTFTAALCDVTGGKPGSVCKASGVQAAAKQLPKHKSGEAGHSGK